MSSAKPRVVISWSSGKDAAWALHVLRQRGDVEVVGLLTTLNGAVDRVAMHGVRRTLLEAQARAAGLPLVMVPLPWPCSNAEYEEAMRHGIAEARERFALTHVAFGDLFLEDVRRYREDRMAETGLEPMFPLWEIPTDRLAREMLASGLSGYLTTVDPRLVPASLVGRRYDESLLADLPASVDPCGERGEFHTFCCAGPMFSQPIPVTVGETVEREGFVYADLLPSTV